MKITNYVEWHHFAMINTADAKQKWEVGVSAYRDDKLELVSLREHTGPAIIHMLAVDARRLSVALQEAALLATKLAMERAEKDAQEKLQ